MAMPQLADAQWPCLVAPYAVDWFAMAVAVTDELHSMLGGNGAAVSPPLVGQYVKKRSHSPLFILLNKRSKHLPNSLRLDQ
jgi:hypothetical protein